MGTVADDGTTLYRSSVASDGMTLYGKAAASSYGGTSYGTESQTNLSVTTHNDETCSIIDTETDICTSINEQKFQPIPSQRSSKRRRHDRKKYYNKKRKEKLRPLRKTYDCHCY